MSENERTLGEVFIPAVNKQGILSELLTFTYEELEDAALLEDIPLGWPATFEHGGHRFRRVGYNSHSLQIFYISDTEHTVDAEQWFAGGGGI